jgi:formamidopyrimidine-DNA glycosylase
MPELPEVETIVRGLGPVLTGRRLGAVILARRDVVHGSARDLAKELEGRKVIRVHRRAKRILIDLSGPAQLVFHLGMSGRLTVSHNGEQIKPHTHLRVGIDGAGQELRFCDPRRFGGIWLIENVASQQGRTLGPLGVEPLEVDAKSFRELLRRNRRIKALLLDQTVIAGLGNIYTDEALHAAGIHPLRLAATVDEAESLRLLRAIRSTLRRAIRHEGSTLMDYRMANGKPGSFQRLHRVYHRAGQPCKTCGVEIVRIIVAGRSTFVCPSCQQPPQYKKSKRQNVRMSRTESQSLACAESFRP